MSAPQSTIYVCSGVRLDSRYNHTIFFDSRVEQRAYFMGKVVKQFSTYSYIRRSWKLKLQATMEQAKTWNYLFFHNGESGKWYYYFINSIEYVNDNTVELSLEMDVMQTYLPTTGSEALDYKLLPCFVERQHSETDEVGVNTVEESLELGDLVCNGQSSFTDVYNEDGDLVDMQDLCIMVMSTKNPESGSKVLASRIHGVFGAIGIYAVSLTRFSSFGSLLKDYDQDTILSMWMYPKHLVELGDTTWDEVESESATQIVYTVSGVKPLSVDKKKSTKLDGYEPINKKLLTYPFNFLYVSNNNGIGTSYKYERFYADVCEFEITGAVSPDGAIRLDPIGYNGASSGSANYEEGMELSNFPTCAWNADTYKIWLAQNQNQLNLSGATAGISVAGGAVAAIAGLATGNMVAGGAGAGMAVGGMSQIFSQLAQKKDMEAQPPQAKGNHSVSINVARGKQTFMAYFKSVDAQHAKIIDDFFSMYGYAIKRVQTPRINVRNHYTYIKTINCQIQGQLCNEDIVKIESIFDKGITFWKRGDEVAEYGLANTNIPV